jgi:ubiquinone/menaquinone biosynthesis C-methylase UbiE
METVQAAACGEWKANRVPGTAWRLARLLIASSKDHAFLDRGWLPWLLTCSPRFWRKGLALRLLSLSPHYWMHQWLECYPLGMSRREVLRSEYERNLLSRRELCDKLLRRYLQPSMTVLDFGCGPGFLARAVSPLVQQVVAADVSRGVIACAAVLNGADNIRYLANASDNLAAVADDSIDLLYSFAVIQHLRKQQTAGFFREFARVLRPGGQGVIHFLLGQSAVHEHQGWELGRVEVRMASFSQEEITDLVHQAGLRDVRVIPVASLGALDDNIGSEHLVLFRREAEMD